MTSPATRWVLPWYQRSRETAAHFNPAFCGELLSLTVAEYRRVCHRPLPLPLAFVVLPLVLHNPTRQALPKRASAIFAVWSAEHDGILPDIAHRTLSLQPATREALLLLAQLGALKMDADGLSLGETPLRHSTRLMANTREVNDMRSAARLLGRWFAQQISPSPIMQAIGVRP